MSSRRKFLKNLGTAGTLAALAPFAAGCAPTMGRKYSYATAIVDPGKLNPVYHWTDVMLQTVRDQAVNPPKATRAFAMGHLAGFLAVNGINGHYDQNFISLPQGPKDANPEIAYGVACADAMADAFQSVLTFDRLAFTDRYPDGPEKTRAIQWGHAVGSAVIKMRTRDGSESSKSDYYLSRYDRRQDSLKWTPTGSLSGAVEGPGFNRFARGLLPGWGAQDPWVMPSARQFLAAPFPAPESDEFARQYHKVRLLGGTDSITRTEDQTQIAFFWEDGPRGITPPGHWQLLAIQLTQDMNFSFEQLAHTFALLSMVQADAAIATWDTKFYYDVLRPETAIRLRLPEIENSSPLIKSDPKWTSLIPTPPFPAYTSGHSTFSGSSAKMLANIIGRDDITFSGSSPDLVNWPRQLTDVKRTWPSLSACADEAGASREYGGIHWEADNKEGLRIGRALADYTYQNAFKKKV